MKRAFLSLVGCDPVALVIYKQGAHFLVFAVQHGRVKIKQQRIQQDFIMKIASTALLCCFTLVVSTWALDVVESVRSRSDLSFGIVIADLVAHFALSLSRSLHCYSIIETLICYRYTRLFFSLSLVLCTSTNCCRTTL